jgi:hypothetical protein
MFPGAASSAATTSYPGDAPAGAGALRQPDAATTANPNTEWTTARFDMVPPLVGSNRQVNATVNSGAGCCRQAEMLELTLLLLGETGAHGRWKPGIGDPTPLGWATVAAYFICAVLGYLALRRARTGPDANGRLAVAWALLMAMMVVLGINKQLDLQSWFTEVARDLALAQGWYERREGVQRAFIYVIASLGVVASLGFAWLLRRELPRIGFAVLGTVFIVVFVLLRASSFHHIDVFLGEGPGGIRMNWILELGGICFVGLNAAWFAFRRRSHGAPDEPVRLVE